MPGKICTQDSFFIPFSFPQEVSLFVFDKKSVEKLYKSKRKDQVEEIFPFFFFFFFSFWRESSKTCQVTELLKTGLGHLQCYRHPRLLQIVHGPEESQEALAFASEPVIGSLANILR